MRSVLLRLVISILEKLDLDLSFKKISCLDLDLEKNSCSNTTQIYFLSPDFCNVVSSFNSFENLGTNLCS